MLQSRVAARAWVWEWSGRRIRGSGGDCAYKRMPVSSGLWSATIRRRSTESAQASLTTSPAALPPFAVDSFRACLHEQERARAAPEDSRRYCAGTPRLPLHTPWPHLPASVLFSSARAASFRPASVQPSRPVSPRLCELCARTVAVLRRLSQPRLHEIFCAANPEIAVVSCPRQSSSTGDAPRPSGPSLSTRLPRPPPRHQPLLRLALTRLAHRRNVRRESSRVARRCPRPRAACLAHRQSQHQAR